MCRTRRPDGYTLLTVSGLQHVYVPATQPGLYEPLKGFAPVSLMFEIVSALAVPEDMPVKNTAEFVEYGRKKSGGLTVGAPGPGSPPHMFGALIGEATGVPVQLPSTYASPPFWPKSPLMGYDMSKAPS